MNSGLKQLRAGQVKFSLLPQILPVITDLRCFYTLKNTQLTITNAVYSVSNFEMRFKGL